MKRVLISFLLVSVVVASAQVRKRQPIQQTGTPAQLETIVGKKANVMLQKMEKGKVTFQPYKSTREMTVDGSKIKSLEFVLTYDAEGVEKSIIAADYPKLITDLDPVMEPIAQYMSISNNMQGVFYNLMRAYYIEGNYTKAREMADILSDASIPGTALKGTVYKALMALAEGDVATAEALQPEVNKASEAAGMYLRANIQKANQQPKVAIATLSDIIFKHANDLEWLPLSELLCAHVYLDMKTAGYTNSAVKAASQVGNLYAGSYIEGEAKTLQSSIKVEEKTESEDKNESEKTTEDE